MNKIIRISLILFLILFTGNHSFSQTSSVKHYGYAAAGKLKIYYCDQGHGPVVFFLHAGFLDMHQWDREATPLIKDHRVITIDLPGHGQSTGIDTVIKIAEVINHVMNYLQVGRASFVGMSLGAACVVDFAIAHPEKTVKLVLCSPGLSGWQDVMRLDTLSKQLFMRSDTYGDTHDPQLISENFVHLWLDGPFRKTATADSAARNYVFKTAFEKVSNNKGSGPVFDKKKAAKRIRLIQKPTLILYGNLDIPFIVQESQYIHKNIKGSQLQVINGTAHLFNFEKPDVFEKYLRSWLK